MTKFILRWTINAVALFLAVYFVDGVNLQGGWVSILWLALIFGLINAFFRTKEGISPTVRLSALQRTLDRRLKAFSKPLKSDCEVAGFFDPARWRARKRFMATGLILVLFAGVVTFATLPLPSAVGAWPFIIAGVITVHVLPS